MIKAPTGLFILLVCREVETQLLRFQRRIPKEVEFSLPGLSLISLSVNLKLDTLILKKGKMGLNEIYTHWKEYVLNVDFFSDEERIIGKLKMSEFFISCHWAEDEEWLMFRAWDAGTIMSFMKCDGGGICWVKSPDDVWIKVGTMTKIGK